MSSSFRCSGPACDLQHANINVRLSCDVFAPRCFPDPCTFFFFSLSDKTSQHCGDVWVSVCLRSGVYEVEQAEARFCCGFITLQFTSYFIHKFIHSREISRRPKNLSHYAVNISAPQSVRKHQVSGHWNIKSLRRQDKVVIWDVFVQSEKRVSLFCWSAK